MAERAAHLSPVSTLFAAFLGYDPVAHLIGPHTLAQLSVAQQHALTGRSFFPGLISAPFRVGLHAALDFAIVASLLAAGASWLRGGRYVYSEPDSGAEELPNEPVSVAQTAGSAQADEAAQTAGAAEVAGAVQPGRRSRRGRPGRDDTGSEVTMSARRAATVDPEVVLRIGEVAKLTGLTTRTLRYWEELGLIAPSSYRGRGERLYSSTDMARALRIKDLQDLLGFSLSEVRVVLDTEDIDVLDRVRSEYRKGDLSPMRRRQLLDDAIEANDRLLDRLDDTLRRIGAFREERANKATRLREARQELEDDPDPRRQGPGSNERSGPRLTAARRSRTSREATIGTTGTNGRNR